MPTRSNKMMNSNTSRFFLMILLLFSTIFLVYYPGLSGGYVLDDNANILTPPGIAMHELSWQSIKNAALSMQKRPLSRTTFGLNYLVTGFDPFYFKLSNVIIHSINALLIFFIALRLIQQQVMLKKHSLSEKSIYTISMAVSLAWALHPINLTNILYVVQRMNSLSSLFVLAGMLCYLQGRLSVEKTPAKGWMLIFSSLLLFLPLAWFSKENGALLPLYILLIEIIFFRFNIKNHRHRNGLYLFFFLILILPAFFVIFYLIRHPEIIFGGYDNRHFSLTERLMTEARILWLYIRMVIFPTPSLFGLFLDDIPISVSLTQPSTTIPAIAGLLILFSTALISIRRMPVLAFGILFFFAGHLMESTVIPLELAFEHRNYLPSFGLLFIIIYYVGTGLGDRLSVFMRTLIITVFILLVGMQTNLRAWSWSNNALLYLSNVEHHPNSARANYEAGRIYGEMLEKGQGNAEENYANAVYYLERSTSLRKNTTSGLFGMILVSIDSDKPVKEEWLKELEMRLSTQALEQVNIVWLNHLTDCVAKGDCRKADLQIPRLANAAIRYSLADNRNRAQLYAILARYAYTVDHDPVTSVIMARKSVSLMPSDLNHRIGLANYLIAINDTQEARKILAFIEKNDTYHQHEKAISTLRELLNNN